jgi:hypothetical protein
MPTTASDSSTSARNELRVVRTWHCNPLCTTLSEAKAWLAQGAPGLGATAATTGSSDIDRHAVAVDGVAGIAEVDAATRGVAVREVALGDIEPAFFLNAVAVGDAVDGIGERVSREAQLAPFRGWDVEMVAPGAVFKTEMSVDGICCFVSTVKTDGYFDFVVYHERGSQQAVANYSLKDSIRGLKHSGDIGSLLHHVKATQDLPVDAPFVMGVVGFQTKMLRTFVSQLPAVCIPSPVERVLKIVPCPLDPASIGDNTMACLVTLTRVAGGKLRWAVLSRPAAAVGIDTDTLSAETARCYREAVAEGALLVSTAAAAAAAAEERAASHQPARRLLLNLQHPPPHRRSNRRVRSGRRRWSGCGE